MPADGLTSLCSNTSCTLLETYFKFLYPKKDSTVNQMHWGNSAVQDIGPEIKEDPL